jgi:hypothetical protein
MIFLSSICLLIQDYHDVESKGDETRLKIQAQEEELPLRCMSKFGILESAFGGTVLTR